MKPTPLMTIDGMIHLEALPTASMTASALGDTLAKNNRYAGRTPEPWSVAAHSVLVSRLCTETQEKGWGLLHDAHEAFIGDIISPAVDFIASQSMPIAGTVVQNCVEQAKAALDFQIQIAWDIEFRDVDFTEIKRLDHVARDAEMFVFFGADPASRDGSDFDRAVEILRGLAGTSHWKSAKRLWILEAEKLARFGALKLPDLQSHQAA